MSEIITSLKNDLQLGELIVDYSQIDSQKACDSPRDIYKPNLDRVNFLNRKVKKMNQTILKQQEKTKIPYSFTELDRYKVIQFYSYDFNNKIINSVNGTSTVFTPEELSQIKEAYTKKEIDQLSEKLEKYLDLINSWYFSTESNNPDYFNNKDNTNCMNTELIEETSGCTCMCTCGARPSFSPENFKNCENSNNRNVNSSSQKEKQKTVDNNKILANMINDIDKENSVINNNIGKEKVININEEHAIESIDESFTVNIPNSTNVSNNNLNSNSKNGIEKKKDKRRNYGRKKKLSSINLNEVTGQSTQNDTTRNGNDSYFYKLKEKCDKKLEDNNFLNINLSKNSIKFNLSSLDLLVNPLRKSKPFEIWTPYELAVFQSSIFKYERDYERILDFLPSKTKEQLQIMYICWSGTSYYKLWHAAQMRRLKIPLY